MTSQDTQISSNEESFGAAEKHFSFNSLEKILGLLACIIPNEASVSICEIDIISVMLFIRCLVGVVYHELSLSTDYYQYY